MKTKRSGKYLDVRGKNYTGNLGYYATPNFVVRTSFSTSFGRPRQDGRIILKWILRTQGSRVWTWFIWLRIGTGGGLL
jgi:hypothetical protein